VFLVCRTAFSSEPSRSISFSKRRTAAHNIDSHAAI
jgi:hypothetical protein